MEYSVTHTREREAQFLGRARSALSSPYSTLAGMSGEVERARGQRRTPPSPRWPSTDSTIPGRLRGHRREGDPGPGGAVRHHHRAPVARCHRGDHRHRLWLATSNGPVAGIGEFGDTARYGTQLGLELALAGEPRSMITTAQPRPNPPHGFQLAHPKAQTRPAGEKGWGSFAVQPISAGETVAACSVDTS